MILPSEINRLRDLRSADTDAHIDLCRPRVVVLSRAPKGVYPGIDPVNLVEYRFSDGQGGSGLQRGDIIRGSVFGVFTANTGGGNYSYELRVFAGIATFAQTVVLQPDLAGANVAWELAFEVRIDGGEGVTINSPNRKDSADFYARMDLKIGDSNASLYSVSEQQVLSYMTVTDPTLSAPQSLAAPLSVGVRYLPGVDTQLTIWGGEMEGL